MLEASDHMATVTELATVSTILLQAMCKADHNRGLRWQRRGSLARSTAATRACHRGNRLSLDKISSPSAAAGRSAVPPLRPVQAAYGVLQPTLREAHARSGMDHT